MKFLKRTTKLSVWMMSFLTALFFVSCAGQNESEFFDESLKASMGDSLDTGIESVDELGGQGTQTADLSVDNLLSEEPSDSTSENMDAETEELDGEMAALLSDEEAGTEGSDALFNDSAAPVAQAVSAEMPMEDNGPLFDSEPAGDIALDSLAAPEAAPLALDSSNFEPATVAALTPEPAARRTPSRARAKSKTPEIAGDAIQEGGKVLNRYYFVRNGDTPESVSEMIYGTQDRVADLLASAGGAPSWEPGTAVYYTSTEQPTDSKMRSFYYERTVKPETYTIKRGDSLAQIAKEAYGDSRSWKEIAVVNQMGDPTDLEEGQLLALAPKNLSDYARNNWIVARQMDPKDIELSEEAMAAQAKAEFNKPLSDIERNANSQQANVGISGFIRQNWLFLGVIMTIGLAALFFLVIMPRRSSF
ncbi:MAG: LysM peptidoglycan-binding domain-containing protein [Bdellovibrionaceae bacterium]|nr:LysM peptidoglycan-binding domain-containing protein [Bdellovibrionales bacterium]MCB9253241.1 LysM peptidoglycan-binding domain-containing protein [Pseudobdellovibrionaceae bacterium]